ncbi:MAG: hypothetical protein FJY07_05205 [Bacteroidetes bacterium]|nr:hypothetical protein [Bacteroidota bacterium]
MRKELLLFIVILPLLSLSQEEKKFGIQFSGFVKTDIFYDTRQTVDLREGHFLILPANEKPDVNGKDINAHSSFNFLSIQTRLNGNITGPDVLKAKTSGYIEAEFFGTSNTDVNGFRLRHAYAMLDWKKSELMIGQFWHPMFITSCFPATLSFNTGAPFEPFSRNPQIRYTFRLGKFRLIGTALAQRDFQNQGPNGSSTEYLRNSGIPEGNLKFEFSSINKEKEKEFLFGVGVDYKTLQPRLFTSVTWKVNDTVYTINPADTLIVPVEKKKDYATVAKVNGLSAFAYFKLKFKPITIKVQGTYGQLTDNLTMLGGYAVSEVTDATTNAVAYTPMNVFAVWTDIHSNGAKWEYGIFGGYTQNLGFDLNPVGDPSKNIYGRGSDIQYVYRVAPRVAYKSGKMKFAFEIEETTAAYGARNNSNKGLVENSKDISNLRFLLGVFYMF